MAQQRILITCLFFIYSANIYTQPDTSIIDSSIYYVFNFEFDKTDAIWNDLKNKKAPGQDEKIFNLGLHILHSKLWQLDTVGYNNLYSELKSAAPNNYWKDRLDLIPIIKLAHDRQFKVCHDTLIPYLNTFAERHGTHPDVIIWKPYLAFSSHFGQVDSELAHDLYLESNELLFNRFNKKVNFSYVLDVLLSVLYFYQNDRQKGITILEKSIGSCKNNQYCKEKMLSVLYRWISSFSRQSQDNVRALKYSNEGLKKATNNYQRATNLMMLGNIHFKLGNQKKCIDAFEEGRAIMKEMFGLHPEYTNVCDDYAVCLSEMNKTDELKTLKVEMDLLPPKAYTPSYGSNTAMPNIYYKIYKKKGQNILALEQIELAMQRSYQDVKFKDHFNPPVSTFPIHRGPINNLVKKAQLCLDIFQYDSKNARVYLDLALQSSMQSDSIFNLLLEKQLNPNSRIKTIQRYIPFLKSHINVAFKKYELSKTPTNFNRTIYFLDKLKSLNLQQELSTSLINKNENTFIKELLEKRKTLRKKVNQSSIPSENDAKESTINLKHRLDSLEIYIRKQYKSYQTSWMQLSKMDSIKQTLKDKEVQMLHWVDSTLFVCRLSSSIEDISIQKVDDSFMNDVHSVFNYLKTKPEANSLYKKPRALQKLKALFFDKSTLDLDKEYIIICSPELEILPFDIFFYDPNQIKIPVISHQYSLATYCLLKQIIQRPVQNIEVYSFGFKGSPNLELIFADEELSNIQESWKSQCDIDAHKNVDFNAFLKQSQNADIVHLITHASQHRQDHKKSHILFVDGKKKPKPIYFNQIDDCSFDAELIVLSACETAIGEKIEGEGLATFANKFISRGARSVVSSLWSVNDRATSIQMASFHKHLANGKAKDVALRDAKIEFISSVDPEFRHPHYWAAFTGVGNMKPLVFKNRNIGFYIIFGLFTLIMAAAGIKYVRNWKTHQTAV